VNIAKLASFTATDIERSPQVSARLLRRQAPAYKSNRGTFEEHACSNQTIADENLVPRTKG
jgi:hypothetical protein